VSTGSGEQNPIAAAVTPRRIDFAGFPVRRSMPNSAVRAVGPWVFFDHMGPFTFEAGNGVDVIPHPRINLATVTYLFEGEILHRDSIGSVQAIRPGAVNLMVAGRGIAHSERTSPEVRASAHGVHGIQLWCGLPEAHEEDAPLFLHYAAEDLPQRSSDGWTTRVMIGRAFGLTSPVKTYSPTLYAELQSEESATVALGHQFRDLAAELALYVVSGNVSLDKHPLQPETLHVLGAQAGGRLVAEGPARVVLIGGEPIGRRYMWWNFVSSSKDRIEQAKADWQANRIGSVPGDPQKAPLPARDTHAQMDD
jgi:hypothetical protein